MQCWHQRTGTEDRGVRSLGIQLVDQERLVSVAGVVLWIPFGALTLRVCQREGHMACKNLLYKSERYTSGLPNVEQHQKAR